MSDINNTSNKTIAKNTLLLYVRMFLTMIIGLYTSRIVLQVLGVDNFGIYNVVGGFVYLLSYIKTGFVTATQRYMNFALGQHDEEELKRIFSNSQTIYYFFSIITLLIAESFGLWYLNNHIVIAPDRLVAANWVFQCAVLMLVVEMISIPYNTCVIAHEHMNVYAYLSILDSLLRLGNVFILMASPYDNLILYALLMLSSSCIIRLLYTVYCKRQFKECHYKFRLDKGLLKGMFIFQGWSALGTLGFTFKDQVVNIIINNILGPAVSAARAIAIQVSGVINQFASNVVTAVSPQITQRYAAGELEESRRLVYISSKFSFFLMAIVVIPLLLNLRYVLQLWLGEVPEYAYEFVIIILIGTLIATLAAPVTTALMATAKIRNFQIGISVIFLLEIPITYYLLKIGVKPYIALLPSILTQFVGVVFRFWILSRQVSGYSLWCYYFKIVLRSLLVVLLSFLICFYLQRFYYSNLIGLLLSSILSIIITGLFILLMGATTEERVIIKLYIIDYVKRKR